MCLRRYVVALVFLLVITVTAPVFALVIGHEDDPAGCWATVRAHVFQPEAYAVLQIPPTFHTTGYTEWEEWVASGEYHRVRWRAYHRFVEHPPGSQKEERYYTELWFIEGPYYTGNWRYDFDIPLYSWPSGTSKAESESYVYDKSGPAPSAKEVKTPIYVNL